MKRTLLLISLFLFGLVTLFMSSAVLFDWLGIREKEGNFVPAVVWANWLCGFLYLIAAYAVFKNSLRAKIPLITAVFILIAAYLYLFIHISNDGLYETKTMGAMAFRVGITALFLFTTIKIFKK